MARLRAIQEPHSFLRLTSADFGYRAPGDSKIANCLGLAKGTTPAFHQKTRPIATCLISESVPHQDYN